MRLWHFLFGHPLHKTESHPFTVRPGSLWVGTMGVAYSCRGCRTRWWVWEWPETIEWVEDDIWSSGDPRPLREEDDPR